MAVIEVKNLNIKTKNEMLFKNFNLTLEEGECIGFYAPTGKGKTTFFNYLAGIIPQNSGFEISGEYRKAEELKLSYIFQNFGLIQYFSVIDNIILPMKNICPKEEAILKSKEILERLWLLHKIDENIIDLSGGEKQRVAIARAFVYPGKLILMDEPFAFQDSEKKDGIIELTKEIIKNENRSALVISHSKEDLDKLCSRIITENEFYCK